MKYEIESDEPVSMAVIRAVSAVTGRDPCSIRPLAEIVDPDALDALFDGVADETPRIGGRLTFVYEQCRVTVEAGEYLSVEPLDSNLLLGATRSQNEVGTQ